MLDNLFHGIIALGKEISLFLQSLAYNKLLIGFIFGIFVAAVLGGLYVVKNPHKIPFILRYPCKECFHIIACRNPDHTCHQTYEEFARKYIKVRILFLTAFIAFCGIVIATLFIFK